MSTKRNKFVLLLLLALLQCFAPLLHAHVHGSSALRGVHIDGMDQLLAANSGAPAFETARDNAPAVAMPTAFRPESAAAPPMGGQAHPAAAAAAARHITLLQLQFPPAFAASSSPGPAPVHSRPFSRAPPPSI